MLQTLAMSVVLLHESENDVRYGDKRVESIGKSFMNL